MRTAMTILMVTLSRSSCRQAADRRLLLLQATNLGAIFATGM
jgi:hypothetical protein